MNRPKMPIVIKLFNPFEKSINGFTLPELLVVMILSGILFLFLFDGLDIINRYGRMTRDKLNKKIELLDGHQALELILEKTDSIRRNNNELILFNSGKNVTRLVVDSTRILLYSNSDDADTLFNNLIGIKYHSLSKDTTSIDSISLFLLMGRDTLKLDYGIPPSVELNLYHTLLNHGNKQ
jgi:prepilin-type N-terminal cleavage/methylation domain-containing protein